LNALDAGLGRSPNSDRIAGFISTTDTQIGSATIAY
jgi:hypothetical protein